MIRTIARACYRHLLPSGAKNSLKAALLLQEIDHPIKAITAFPQTSVLVLAPHMDDETIGCGGSMMLHAEGGARVTVCYTTDGRRGDPSLYRPTADVRAIAAGEERIRRVRRCEAEAACAVLGAAHIEWLDGPDGGLEPTPALVEGLSGVMNRQRPQVVYLPSPLDEHRDHWGTNRLLVAAWRAGAHRPDLVRGYEVWSPLVANRVIDVTANYARKREAMACFPSQLLTTDYARAMEGLDQYRAVHRFGGTGYAEAFWEATPEVYAELCARLEVTRR